jgi:hypothetical protein
MKAVRFGLETALVKVLAAATGPMSMATARRCGAAVGRLAYTLDRFHRDIAGENLARAFPSRTAAERHALTRSMFAHFGSLLFELLKVGGLSQAELLRLIEFEGDERVAHAYARGKGVLFFTGHFGYWEIQAIAQPLVAYPVSVLARPLDNPSLHRWLERIRTSTGNTVIYRQGAIRKVLRELSNNRGVAILIDQARRGLRRLLRAPRGHYFSAGGAGAPHGRRSGSRLCAAAAGRPLPFRLRASGGAALVRFGRRRDAVHAALHRRAGDVRTATPRAVVVDAPALADARARAGRGAAAGRRCTRRLSRSGCWCWPPTGLATP